MLGFSAMGYGVPVFKFLGENSDFGSAGIGVACFIGLALYLLDAEYWSGEYDRTFWSCNSLKAIKPLNKLRKVTSGLLSAVLFAV